MKRARLVLFLLAVLTLAGLAARFYGLSQAHSLNQDEALGAYDAYSLLLTGKDSWGQATPILFREYGMYVNQFQSYFALPFVALLGLTEEAARVPWALWGALVAIAVFILGKELYGEKAGLAAALFAAFSPYLLTASRMALPSNLVHFPVAAAIALFAIGLRKPKLLPFSALFFGIAANTYGTLTAFVPLFLAPAALIYRKELLRDKKQLLLAVIVLAAFALPLAHAHLSNPASNAYYSQVSVFDTESYYNANHDAFPQSLASNFLSYFTPSVLTCTPQSEPYSCLLPPEILLLALAGAVIILYNTRKDKRALLPLLWIAAAALSVSFFYPAGNARRYSHALPAFLVLAGIGASWMYVQATTNKRKALRGLALLALAIVLAVFISTTITALEFNHSTYPLQYDYLHQPGWKQAVLYAESHPEYDYVFLTPNSNQAYAYVLFYTKYSPEQFQQQSTGKSTPPGNWAAVTQVGQRYLFCQPSSCPAASNPLYLLNNGEAGNLSTLMNVPASPLVLARE
ncbi:hypothetical protein AUJ14_02600 [Candidatus Micrarchaeota archaeon CG1_02_55_22]|nr:MAG: hypothetical protein AUJ14_02600 [Candidatus Micrarchaeota archaeon CG1_02_55_22]